MLEKRARVGQEWTNGENTPGEGVYCEAASHADPTVAAVWRRFGDLFEGELVGECCV